MLGDPDPQAWLLNAGDAGIVGVQPSEDKLRTWKRLDRDKRRHLSPITSLSSGCPGEKRPTPVSQMTLNLEHITIC